jgi:hypothetical protein
MPNIRSSLNCKLKEVVLIGKVCMVKHHSKNNKHHDRFNKIKDYDNDWESGSNSIIFFGGCNKSIYYSGSRCCYLGDSPCDRGETVSARHVCNHLRII